MESVVNFALQERYKQVKDIGDRLGEMATLIEWEPFWEIVRELYTNTTEQGGRSNIDVVLKIKLLVLQSMYGLSDPVLERQANDKISFLRFLGFPEKVPDHTTVWNFRERLSKTKKDRAIWNELQRQREGKGLKIRKGVIQDSTFITEDPRHASSDTPRGDEAKPGEIKNVPGQKRGRSPILDLNSMRKKTATSD